MWKSDKISIGDFSISISFLFQWNLISVDGHMCRWWFDQRRIRRLDSQGFVFELYILSSTKKVWIKCRKYLLLRMRTKNHINYLFNLEQKMSFIERKNAHRRMIYIRRGSLNNCLRVCREKSEVIIQKITANIP